LIDHKIEAEAFTSLLLEEDIEASLLEVFDHSGGGIAK